MWPWRSPFWVNSSFYSLYSTCYDQPIYAPAIRLRADLKRVLNVFNNNTQNSKCIASSPIRQVWVDPNPKS